MGNTNFGTKILNAQIVAQVASGMKPEAVAKARNMSTGHILAILAADKRAKQFINQGA